MSTTPQAQSLKSPTDSAAHSPAEILSPTVLLSEEKRFYVVDKTHTELVSFWRPGAKGRTYDLNEAGTWTEQELESAYFRHNPELIFVPVESIADKIKTTLVLFNRDLRAVQP